MITWRKSYSHSPRLCSVWLSTESYVQGWDNYCMLDSSCWSSLSSSIVGEKLDLVSAFDSPSNPSCYGGGKVMWKSEFSHKCIPTKGGLFRDCHEFQGFLCILSRCALQQVHCPLAQHSCSSTGRSSQLQHGFYEPVCSQVKGTNLLTCLLQKEWSP